MSDLRRVYLENLAARIHALEASQEALGRGEPEARRSVRRIAHALRGSGATYGFPEITCAAEAVDEADDPALETTLEALLQVLREAIDRRPGDQEPLLLVTSDDSLAEGLEARLRSDGVVTRRFDRLAEASRYMASGAAALVLVDLTLADGDGRDLVAELRADPRRAGLPIVALGPAQAPVVAAECLALGADDFRRRDTDLDLLAAGLTARLGRSAELRRSGQLDPLTDLTDRNGFQLVVRRGQALARRNAIPLALGLIDVDRFKAVNDTFGHAVGDLTLRHLAQRLTGGLRHSDTVGRWGGEEFIVFLPGSTSAGAGRALEGILKTCREHSFEAPGGERFQLTFSAGVVGLDPEEPLEEAVARADRLLYLAKESGRDRVLSSAAPVPTRRHRILVIDDDPDLTALLRRELEAAGYGVTTAASGEEALERLPRTGADLALVDIDLPAMDGLTLLGHLRHRPQTAHIPIFMLTSVGDDTAVLRAFDLGADDYILKPFSPPALLARLRRSLERRGSLAPATSRG